MVKCEKNIYDFTYRKGNHPVTDNVMERILAAEREAEKRIRTAKKDAADRISQAEADAACMIDEAVKDAETALKAAAKKAQEKSLQIKKLHTDEAISEAESMIRSVGDHFENAVAVVVQEIVRI